MRTVPFVAPRALFSFAALTIPSIAQDDVRLTQVPERVVLPARSGTNLLLEAEVPPATDRVWLAASRDQLARVPMRSVGGQRFQLNLADPRVLRLLHAERGEGEFFVFAARAAAVHRSAPVSWTRGEQPAARLRAFLIGTDGVIEKASKDEVRWLDPATIERFEVHGVRAPSARAVARAGQIDIPLSWRADDRFFALDFNDGVRRSLQDANRAAIEVRVGDVTTMFDYRIVPARLAVDADPTFTVMQRRRGNVPGSRGWLEVSLGDVTMGQVLLAIHDATGRTLVAAHHVAERDPVEIRLADESYVLTIDKLTNRLIGDDWAELSVRPARDFVPDAIAQLIRAVAAADGMTFVREGRDYPPTAAAQLLRARLGSHRGERPTPAQFLEMASRSTTTGKPYRVRDAAGNERNAKDWLQELLEAIESDNAAGTRGGAKK